MIEKQKTAIILIGGGMKSAHGAGFLYALATKLGITQPDIMLGSSGNAGNVLYFCAGQYESMRKIWTQLLSTRKFISLLRFWRILDVDYLIDVVFKQKEPLNAEKLAASPIEWYVPISDYETGRTRYTGATDGLDAFEILRAAKAIPILFRKRIAIGAHYYLDGELGPVLQDHVAHVLAHGATRIAIVDNFAGWHEPRSGITRLWSHLVPLGLREAVARDIATNSTLFQAPHAQVLFVASQGLPCTTATRSQPKLQATFNRGYQDALALESELRTLFV